jgi:uncharacterized membrane protein YkgB
MDRSTTPPRPAATRLGAAGEVVLRSPTPPATAGTRLGAAGEVVLRSPTPPAIAGRRLAAAGGTVLRAGLVGILLYFGAFKFTAVEAEAIRPLVASSPVIGWLHGVLGVQGTSNLLGVVELALAALIALRPIAPAWCALGSLGATGMFLTTLSFLASAPGVWVRVPGFALPVPSALGAFLLKDVFLLGAALWSAGEALAAGRRA